MSQNLRDLSRQVVTPEGRVEIDRLCAFIDALQEWLDEFQRKGREAGKKPKASLTKYLDVVSRILSQFPACMTAVTSQLSHLLSTMLSPLNDPDVRHGAWETGMLFLDACCTGQELAFDQVAHIVVAGLALPDELPQAPRIPIGSSGSVTPETVTAHVERLMEFVEGARQRDRALFWWKVVGSHVMPRFFERKKRREFRTAKVDLSVRFMKALAECLRRFPTLSLHELAMNDRKFSIYVIEMLREAEAAAMDDEQVHGWAMEFFKVAFPCCFTSRDTGRDIEVRRGIMETELPPHLWLTLFAAIPSGSVTQFFNIVHTFAEGSAAFMNLANIAVKLVMPFFARVQKCKERTDEFWDVMSSLVTHAIRAMVIANEIMNAGGSHIQEMLTFLMVNQDKAMGPFLCSFVVALVYRRMQVNELPKGVYESMQNVLSITSRNSISSSKEPLSVVLWKLGGQIAVAMAPYLFGISDKDMEHNPVVFEYRLNRWKCDGPDPEEYDCYFYPLTQEATYNKDEMMKLINGLCNGADEKVGCRIMTGFLQILLDISALKKVETDVFEILAPMAHDILAKCAGFDYDALYHLWFRIIIADNSRQRINRKTVHEWYRITCQLIDSGSDVGLFDGMQGYLSLIPGSLAMIPHITKMFSIDCFQTGNGLQVCEITVFIRFLISLGFMRRSCKSPNSGSRIRSFGLNLLLTVLQLENHFRKTEIEDTVVYLLITELLELKDSDETIDPEVEAIFTLLVNDMSPESHMLMSKLAILPSYYQLLRKKCPGLIESIIDVLPKHLYSATHDFFHWAVVFLVNTLLVVKEESVVNRCMAMLAFDTEDVKKREMLASATVYLLAHYDREDHSFEINPDIPTVVLSKEQDMVWQLDLADKLTVRTIRKNGSSDYRVKSGEVFSNALDKWILSAPGVSVLLNAFHAMSHDHLTCCLGGVQAAADAVKRIRQARENVVSVIGDPSDEEFVAFCRALFRPTGYILNTRFKYVAAQDDRVKQRDTAIIWSNQWEPNQELVTRYNLVIRKGDNGYFSIRQERSDRSNQRVLFGFGQITVPKPVLPIIAGWAAATTASMNRSQTCDDRPELPDSFNLETIL